MLYNFVPKANDEEENCLTTLLVHKEYSNLLAFAATKRVMNEISVLKNLNTFIQNYQNFTKSRIYRSSEIILHIKREKLEVKAIFK